MKCCSSKRNLQPLKVHFDIFWLFSGTGIHPVPCGGWTLKKPSLLPIDSLIALSFFECIQSTLVHFIQLTLRKLLEPGTFFIAQLLVGWLVGWWQFPFIIASNLDNRNPIECSTTQPLIETMMQTWQVTLHALEKPPRLLLINFSMWGTWNKTLIMTFH